MEETCPHGTRITCAAGSPVVFIDGCQVCQDVLTLFGFRAAVPAQVSQEEKATVAA